MRNIFGSHTPGREFRGYVDGFGNVCDSSTKLPVGRITQFGLQDSNGHPIGIIDRLGNINNGSTLPAGRIDSFGNVTSRTSGWNALAPASLRSASKSVTELLATVRNSSKQDADRLSALDELISCGAVDELFSVVNDTSRYDSWRVRALDALCEMAARSSDAASCLSQLVNNTSRYDSWRLKALRGLVSADCRDYLRRIAANSSRHDSWREEARRALGE